MNVLLVTTWDTPCGIAEHSRMLKGAVEAADPEITITPSAEALDPAALAHSIAGASALLGRPTHFDLLHLNYHAALHSRWTPEAIRAAQSANCPVLVTYHDTGVPNSAQAQAICGAADAAVIHEPATDLPGTIHYWRQGVPEAPSFIGAQSLLDAMRVAAVPRWSGQPILGSVGFPFPWKNYALLAEASAAAGWALLLLAPGATPAQVAEWRALNPASLILTDFVPAQTVVRYLAGCDATAFVYTCANTGTSGAIRQGLAARKPVLATRGCRQFRDLAEDTIGQAAIRWVLPSVDSLVTTLSRLPLGRLDAGSILVANLDGWPRVGRRYAELYRQLSSRAHHTSTEEQP